MVFFLNYSTFTTKDPGPDPEPDPEPDPGPELGPEPGSATLVLGFLRFYGLFHGIFYSPFFEIKPVACSCVDLDVYLPGRPLDDELVESCTPHDDSVVGRELCLDVLVTPQLDLEASVKLC